MNEQLSPITALLIGGSAAAGGYLLSFPRQSAPRRTAAGLAAIALAALLSLVPLFGRESLMQFLPTAVGNLAFLLPAGVGAVAAILAVTSRQHTTSVAWFSLAAVANSALFLFSGAWLIGLANVIVAVGLISTLFYLAARSTPFAGDTPASEPTSEFQWAACAAGGLLLACLLSAVSAIATPTNTSSPAAKSVTGIDWSELGRALLFNHGVSLVVMGLLLFLAIVMVVRMSVSGGETA